MMTFQALNGVELSCDGLDNDCDGETDENVPLNLADLQGGVCEGAQKVCAGAMGQVEPDYTRIQTYEAEEVTCDGLNNDCDLNVDEGVTAPLASKQIGVCLGSRQVCNGFQGFGEPDYTQIANYELSESTCDGIDNDCDDRTDENVVLPLSDKQRGVCFGARQICAGAAGFLEPDYVNTVPLFEDTAELSCDGLDNDCDGEVDETFTPSPADNQVGVCSGAVKVCAGINGLIEPSYETIPNYQIAETICDGADNDCDGISDESIALELADNQRVMFGSPSYVPVLVVR